MFPILTVLIAMLSIQSGASLAKSLFPILGPTGTTTLRIGFAALLLIFIFRPWRSKVPKEAKGSILLYGASLGLMNLSFYWALVRIPLGIAVALEFVGPLGVALWASRQKLDFLWAILAAVGIYFVLPLQSEISSEHLDPLGIVYALVAGGFWGLYIIFGQRITQKLPTTQAASLGMAVAALVALPFGVIDAGSQIGQIQHWPLALVIAVLSSALPYSLEMHALKSIPTKTFGILMSLEPAVAALAGFAFLHEHLSFTQVAAILCVMVASLGSTLSSRKATV